MKTVSINIRSDDNESLPYLKKLIEILDKNKLTIQLPDHEFIKNDNISKYITDARSFIELPDLAVSIGGDGTLLKTARTFAGSDIPLLGINRGRLGFLTEFMPGEALSYIENITAGSFSVTARDMLNTEIRNRYSLKKTLCFLNDTVISRGIFTRPIIIDLEIDGKFLNSFSGDGLIISTATGSTAYSLSAGGPIITPDIENIFIVMPVCPHTLATRPLIVSGNSKLKVKISSEFENSLLTIDGYETTSIEPDDEITFSGSGKKAYLISHPERSFYDILREKFNWGKHIYNQEK